MRIYGETNDYIALIYTTALQHWYLPLQSKECVTWTHVPLEIITTRLEYNCWKIVLSRELSLEIKSELCLSLLLSILIWLLLFVVVVLRHVHCQASRWWSLISPSTYLHSVSLCLSLSLSLSLPVSLFLSMSLNVKLVMTKILTHIQTVTQLN